MDFKPTEPTRTSKSHQNPFHVSIYLPLPAKYHLCHRRNLLPNPGTADSKHGEKEPEELWCPGEVSFFADSDGMSDSLSYANLAY